MFNLRNYGFSKPAALLTALMFSAGYATAQVQTVTGSHSRLVRLSAGQSTELTVSYTATDADGADAATTGLGLRLHYEQFCRSRRVMLAEPFGRGSVRQPN